MNSIASNDTSMVVGRGVRRIALFAGGVLAGMVLFLIAPRSTFRSGTPNQRFTREFTRLRRQILGSNRRDITRALGPPRTAAMANDAPQAETWYYAIGPRSALAVCFRGEKAQRVEFFSTPVARPSSLNPEP
jgi:hypothetical protein